MGTNRQAKVNRQQRPRHKLGELARQVGCHLGCIGDIEQLAGIDIKSAGERRELWFQFRHLFDAPTQQLCDGVMDHCSAIALRRIEAGELSLIRTRYC